MSKINRNEFLKEFGFKGSALFALYCTGISCLPSEVNPEDAEVSLSIDLDAEANSDLLESGGYIVQNAIVVANNNGTFIAATQICSHENKREIVFKDEEWYCTDHGARFSLAGEGLNKDGAKGLTIYTVTQNGNILSIA